MKQNKLFTLACFSLLSLSGLASCSGSGNIPQKVDCYFRAQVATINEDGERVKVDFKDDECAEMTVEGKDSLKYGEQDVIIHIKPKPFFTFKNYDTTTWEPIGGAFHPYVGLGNPHSLYSYPLQENVAWTFEDLSTGAFKEEYKITVKKEFFQKNIVIDYGNAGGLNNNVLIYNSSHYAERFKNALSPELGVYYKLDPKYSSFLAGSDGLTVTYTFAIKNSLFTFAGWDNPIKPKKALNEGEPLEYAHFKVLVTDKKGVTKNIATYDPNVEKSKQLFIPTVLDDKISFFINWKLLAEDNKEYEPLYDGVKVEFVGDYPDPQDPNHYMPSVSTKVQVNSIGESEVKFYACDYVQRMPYQQISELSTSEVVTYKEDESGQTELPFGNFDVFQRKERAKKLTTNYATLFEIPENIEEFECKFINPKGETTLYVKPNEDIHWAESDYNHSYSGTNWRVEQLGNAETELRYWTVRNDKVGDIWFLVQLNPTYMEGPDSVTRNNEYLPSEFVGKNNLFYLFANADSAEASPFYDHGSERYFDQYQIQINVPEAPHATATLADASQVYGSFSKQGDTTYNVKIGVDTVDIPFYCNKPEGEEGVDYTNKSFEVAVKGKKSYDATYIPTYQTGKDHAIIRVNVASPTPFERDEQFTITLKLADNKIVIADYSNCRQLGGFWVDNEIVYEIKPQEGNKQEFTFKLKSDYYDTNPEYYPNSLRFEYFYDAVPHAFNQAPEGSDPSTFNITLWDIPFSAEGGTILTIVPVYACEKLADGDSTKNYGTFVNGKQRVDLLDEIMGNRSETYVEFIPNETYKDAHFVVAVDSKIYPSIQPRADYYTQPDADGTIHYIIHVWYDSYEQAGMRITNGEVFTIHLNIG